MSASSTPGNGRRIESLPDLVVPFKRPVYEGVIGEFEHFVLATYDAKD